MRGSTPVCKEVEIVQGSVTKKRDRWYIYYFIGKDANGKWKRKWEGSWTTKREAERALRARIDELECTFERKVDESTVAVFLRHWLKEVCEPRLAANTVNGYRVNIEKHIIPHIGSIQLNRLQPKDLQRLYDDLAADGLSGTSIRYVHNNLHRALKYAVRSQVLTKNAADFVEPPKVNGYEATPLTPEQVKTLLRSCSGTEIYMPVLLAVTLGLRRGEALGLQWECVDFDAKTVTIAHSASFRKGGIELSTTKTKNSRRTLLMPDILHDALESTLSKQNDAARFLGAAYNPLHLVCCRFDGQPVTSGVLQHQFHEVLTAAGLPSIRYHDLRHTNATLMLRNAVPAKIVSAMLGHSSIGITLDTYSHVITEMQEGAVGVMDGLLKGIS
ncbi:MAG: site-specific integrase [Ruminococcaceae bacterium]|nr:site-specific integrase [Oscillospiraceae bacterium]